MWINVVELVLVFEPSPKSQNRLVIVPVEVSVKLTANGFEPLVGVAEKFASGTNAPVPVTGLVLPPALAELNTTTLLKLVAFVGAKFITTFVKPKLARVNEAPDRIENVPALTVAVPLLSVAPPRLVTVKLA